MTRRKCASLSCGLVSAVVLLASAHRSPAPVIEVESTPTPSPQPTATIAATPRPTRKPPPSRAENETKNGPKSKPTPQARQRFAGKWIGTMMTFPAGQQATVITIDPSETKMTVEWFQKTGTANTIIEGDTIRATFPAPPMQPETHKWALTPQPDGVTASVRFRCFMNDNTAVFHRSAVGKPSE